MQHLITVFSLAPSFIDNPNELTDRNSLLYSKSNTKPNLFSKRKVNFFFNKKDFLRNMLQKKRKAWINLLVCVHCIFIDNFKLIVY